MPVHPSRYTHLFWTTLALVLLLAWDASGWDVALARPFATAQGFAWRDQWLLSELMHKGMQRAAWLPCLWLIIGIWKPTGILRRLDRRERVQWVAATLVSLAVISSMKQLSHTSCPWDMAEFGGQAHWVSHWAWRLADGGNGHCFPAGHASAAFAFLGGYFALRRRLPRQALLWLAGVLAVGLVIGVGQQVRGAHFMSHTLWTAWLCWIVGWLADGVARRFPASPAPADWTGTGPLTPPGRS
jgi:membrane-associated PAP2 superfamily phosphatase